MPVTAQPAHSAPSAATAHAGELLASTATTSRAAMRAGGATQADANARAAAEYSRHSQRRGAHDGGGARQPSAGRPPCASSTASRHSVIVTARALAGPPGQLPASSAKDSTGSVDGGDEEGMPMRPGKSARA